MSSKQHQSISFHFCLLFLSDRELLDCSNCAIPTNCQGEAKFHLRSVKVSRSQNPVGKDIASVHFLSAFGRGQWIRLFLCVIFEARNASELTPGIAKFSIHFLNWMDASWTLKIDLITNWTCHMLRSVWKAYFVCFYEPIPSYFKDSVQLLLSFCHDWTQMCNTIQTDVDVLAAEDTPEWCFQVTGFAPYSYFVSIW